MYVVNRFNTKYLKKKVWANNLYPDEMAQMIYAVYLLVLPFFSFSIFAFFQVCLALPF